MIWTILVIFCVIINTGTQTQINGVHPMDTNRIFFICPVCFQTCETEPECHAHKMIECNVDELDDNMRKPIRDNFGNMVSRAPRWYMEAVGWIQVESD